MRNIFALILILFTNQISGQTRKFLVTDTSAIRISIHTDETPTDTLPIKTVDTAFYFKENIINAGGHLIGYFDTNLSKKAIEATFDKTGKQIGYRDSWYRNGQLKEHFKESIYVKDFIFYDITQWYPDSKIKHRNFYNGKDSTTSIYYYNNGNIKDIEKEYYDRSLPHQVYCYNERRFENGQLCSTPLIDNWLTKRQQVLFYYSNGKVKISCTMFFVECIGKYEEWDKHGTLIISGQYEDYPNLETEMIHAWRRPDKIGKWEYFNDKGDLTKEELYNDKGELIQTTNK